MSFAAFTLNGLLCVLLFAALAVGWRLERRLKALRDSHEGFAKAVGDLDAAALRAERGLADLRAATDEAAESLAGRIEAARRLALRLDNAMAAAPPEQELLLKVREPRPAAAAVRPTPPPPERSRAPVDDDLFDSGVSLRAIVGGRR
jgi:hypothetical protein